MQREITYGAIEDLMEGAGFVRTVVPGSHVAYDHAASGASLLLPIHGRRKKAPARHLAMAERTLVDFGLLTEEQFRTWMNDPKSYQAA
jgi:predicted RNA binding protein YcfA (HicA-like mRNA interferase family)